MAIIFEVLRVYINDLIAELNNYNLGVKLGDIKISILLFADDIVLITDSDINIQQMLNVVNNWCHKWRLIVNKDKTKVVHFRKPQQPRSQYVFKYGIDVP